MIQGEMGGNTVGFHLHEVRPWDVKNEESIGGLESEPEGSPAKG